MSETHLRQLGPVQQFLHLERFFSKTTEVLLIWDNLNHLVTFLSIHASAGGAFWERTSIPLLIHQDITVGLNHDQSSDFFQLWFMNNSHWDFPRNRTSEVCTYIELQSFFQRKRKGNPSRVTIDRTANGAILLHFQELHNVINQWLNKT